MKNVINYCPTPFNGIERYSTSAFFVPDDENLTAPFSFRSILDIFKKKDSGTSSSSSDSGSSTSVKKGTGIGAGILTGVLGLAGAAGALAPILPEIGIGSKSRIAETNATAAANTQIYNAQTQSTLATIEAEKSKSKETEKIILIGFVSLLVIIMVVGVLFKKR